jgi:SOS-response transcriptional repressor LexA
MDKYEKRRLKLLALRQLLCRDNTAELARRLGKSDSYVTRMLYPEGKDGRKRIGEEMADAIDEAFGWAQGSFDSALSAEELAAAARRPGSSNKADKVPLFGKTNETFDGRLLDRNVEPGPEIKGKLPLISWVQAGAWESVVDNFAPGDAEEWILSPVAVSESAFYLRVRGQSMYSPNGEPSFRENDLILVDPQGEADSGSLVIVRMDDSAEATFKQLIIEDGKKYLKALNPSWPNRIVQVNGNATICGVVKTKIVKY